MLYQHLSNILPNPLIGIRNPDESLEWLMSKTEKNRVATKWVDSFFGFGLNELQTITYSGAG